MRSVFKLLVATVVATSLSALSASALASSGGWSRFCVLTRQQAIALVGHIDAREGNATERYCSYVGDPYGLDMTETAAPGAKSRSTAGTKVTVLHGIGHDATLSTRPVKMWEPGESAQVAFTVGATRYQLGLTVTRTALSSKQVSLLVDDARALAVKLEK